MGVAAIKYFDLKQNRLSDYKFLYDHMLDPNGNTAVYLMYSYVRILSVLRKSGVNVFNLCMARSLRSRRQYHSNARTHTNAIWQFSYCD